MLASVKKDLDHMWPKIVVRVYGLGQFRVCSLGFMVLGLGFRV